MLMPKAAIKTLPARAVARALELFSNDFLKHVIVEREAGDQLLELAVLLFELAQLA